MKHGRRWAGAAITVLAVVVALAGVIGSAAPAHAATAYRYWAYFFGNGSSWQYGNVGPASEHPHDGDVQGWRFAVQADQATLTPRVAPNFASVCGSTPAQAGHIRVGLVIDFGTASDAPPGEHPPTQTFAGCVTVAATINGVPASGFDVLAAAVGRTGVRIGDTGLVCGIDGYPKSECAPVVQAPASTPSPAQTPHPLLTPSPSATAHPTHAAATGASGTVATQAESSASAQKAPSQVRPSSSTSTAAVASATTESSAPASAVPIQSAPLSALRTKAAHHFPFGALLGGIVAVGLAGAALVTAKRKGAL